MACRECYPHGPADPCTCEGCWACPGREIGCTCDIAWDCEHDQPDHEHHYFDTAIGRLCVTCRERQPLTILEAHTAADCPDRDHCWASAIHDEHHPRVGVVRAAAGGSPEGPADV